MAKYKALTGLAVKGLIPSLTLHMSRIDDFLRHVLYSNHLCAQLSFQKTATALRVLGS